MLKEMELKTSNDFLKDIPEAILDKRDVIKLKMQRYKDVKVYLYSTLVPEYLIGERVLDELVAHKLFSYLIMSVANKTVYNPRIVTNNVDGSIIHVVLCFEHE